MMPPTNRGLGVWECPVASFWRCFFGKIYDFSRMTSNRHKCFEKDLFTIVVAMSTESYFPLHFSWKIIINTQICRFCDYPRGWLSAPGWRCDSANYTRARIIKMTMKFYYPRPWFIKVNVPATEFAANGVREGALVLSETGAILQCLLAVLLKS